MLWQFCIVLPSSLTFTAFLAMLLQSLQQSEGELSYSRGRQLQMLFPCLSLHALLRTWKFWFSSSAHKKGRFLHDYNFYIYSPISALFCQSVGWYFTAEPVHLSWNKWECAVILGKVEYIRVIGTPCKTIAVGVYVRSVPCKFHRKSICQLLAWYYYL